ncbi:hypothetical protein MA04_02757 [Alcanivorax balearicus MACL04]|uniref:DUF218 domain-containing protein n=1 Tax=Alloalcanivorax balearicus MACL04 TaxID=1177182 RepID=A0ABT2R0Z5_9GAMM|nr:ElyC/SanA/YdcF family protein [Alloalcanivorax balearicus]MCU5783457.1 hypothetical protein [Alloalcanivorax balearicus MACL04]
MSLDTFQWAKVVASLAMPVSPVLLLLICGTVLLWWGRARRWALAMVTTGTALLLLFTLPGTARWLGGPLEHAYPPLTTPPPASWVVVLGGGALDDPALPPPSRLRPHSLARLAEGVRQFQLQPSAKLIVSGGAPDTTPDTVTSADAMAAVATAWGVPEEAIWRSRDALNTEQEARAVARWVPPEERVILVTSALHMPRALALFRQHGIDAVPAPAGPYWTPGLGRAHWGDRLPGAEPLYVLELSWWERLGAWWQGDTR